MVNAVEMRGKANLIKMKAHGNIFSLLLSGLANQKSKLIVCHQDGSAEDFRKSAFPRLVMTLQRILRIEPQVSFLDRPCEWIACRDTLQGCVALETLLEELRTSPV